MECKRTISADQFVCLCGADQGGGEELHFELFDRQKEKAMKSISRAVSYTHLRAHETLSDL
eukprot:9521266-Karenia_brevis.AAC.1